MLNSEKKCLVCGSGVHARGLCSTHYSEQRKLNFPIGDSPKRIPKDLRPSCQAEGCADKALNSKMYCHLHQRRFEKHGDPLKVKKVYAYGDRTCLVEGCVGKGRLKQGYCSSHYQRLMAHGDPLKGNKSPAVSKALDHEDGTRTCSQCEVRQELSNFYTDKLSTLGRKSKCKKCVSGIVSDNYRENSAEIRVKVKARRINNPEKTRQAEKERYERDKPKRLDLANKHAAIRRARQAEVEIDKGITPRRVRKRDGDNCFYCGKVMDFTPASNRIFKDDHATLEHVIPLSKGGNHSWDNVVLACRRCNLMKNNKSVKEFEEYLSLFEKE